MQCLAAGKHVLLEKPLSHTLESCVRLVGAAEEARSVFMVGENSAFWPEVGWVGEGRVWGRMGKGGVGERGDGENGMGGL